MEKLDSLGHSFLICVLLLSLWGLSTFHSTYLIMVAVGEGPPELLIKKHPCLYCECCVVCVATNVETALL